MPNILFLVLEAPTIIGLQCVLKLLQLGQSERRQEIWNKLKQFIIATVASKVDAAARLVEQTLLPLFAALPLLSSVALFNLFTISTKILCPCCIM